MECHCSSSNAFLKAWTISQLYWLSPTLIYETNNAPEAIVLLNFLNGHLVLSQPNQQSGAIGGILIHLLINSPSVATSFINGIWRKDEAINTKINLAAGENILSIHWLGKVYPVLLSGWLQFSSMMGRHSEDHHDLVAVKNSLVQWVCYYFCLCWLSTSL